MAKNDASLSKGKETGSLNAENTNMHKLLFAMPVAWQWFAKPQVMQLIELGNLISQ